MFLLMAMFFLRMCSFHGFVRAMQSRGVLGVAAENTNLLAKPTPAEVFDDLTDFLKLPKSELSRDDSENSVSYSWNEHFTELLPRLEAATQKSYSRRKKGKRVQPEIKDLLIHDLWRLTFVDVSGTESAWLQYMEPFNPNSSLVQSDEQTALLASKLYRWCTNQELRKQGGLDHGGEKVDHIISAHLGEVPKLHHGVVKLAVQFHQHAMWLIHGDLHHRLLLPHAQVTFEPQIQVASLMKNVKQNVGLPSQEDSGLEDLINCLCFSSLRQKQKLMPGGSTAPTAVDLEESMPQISFRWKIDPIKFNDFLHHLKVYLSFYRRTGLSSPLFILLDTVAKLSQSSVGLSLHEKLELLPPHESYAHGEFAAPVEFFIKLYRDFFFQNITETPTKIYDLLLKADAQLRTLDAGVTPFVSRYFQQLAVDQAFPLSKSLQPSVRQISNIVNDLIELRKPHPLTGMLRSAKESLISITENVEDQEESVKPWIESLCGTFQTVLYHIESQHLDSLMSTNSLAVQQARKGFAPIIQYNHKLEFVRIVAHLGYSRNLNDLEDFLAILTFKDPLRNLQIAVKNVINSYPTPVVQIFSNLLKVQAEFKKKKAIVDELNYIYIKFKPDVRGQELEKVERELKNGSSQVPNSVLDLTRRLHHPPVQVVKYFRQDHSEMAGEIDSRHLELPWLLTILDISKNSIEFEKQKTESVLHELKATIEKADTELGVGKQEILNIVANRLKASKDKGKQLTTKSMGLLNQE